MDRIASNTRRKIAERKTVGARGNVASRNSRFSGPEFLVKEIAVDDFLTNARMTLSDNEQTWLFCPEGHDPNEIVDVYDWLGMPDFSSRTIHYGKAYIRGGNPFRTTNVVAKSGGRCDTTGRIDCSIDEQTFRKIALSEFELSKNNEPTDLLECEDTSNVSLLENVSSPSELSLFGSFSADRRSSSAENPTIMAGKEKFRPPPSDVCESPEIFRPISKSTPTRKLERKSFSALNDTYNLGNGGSPYRTKRAGKADTKGDRYDISDGSVTGYMDSNDEQNLSRTFKKTAQNDLELAKIKETTDVLESETTSSDSFLETASRTSPLNLHDSLTMSQNRMTNRRSPLVQNLTFKRKDRKQPVHANPCKSPVSTNETFQPVSISTPMRKQQEKHSPPLNYTYDNFGCECGISRTFTENYQPNLSDSELCIGNSFTMYSGPCASVLSKSDPAILDSVQELNERRSSNCDLSNYNKFDRTYEAKPNTLQRKTLTVENDDDNTSTASDSSNVVSHIQSLGDVRSLARQQEETLMSGRDASSRLKKGLSDDCSIHIASSSDTCSFKTARSSSVTIYGSATSINNNNISNTNLTGITAPSSGIYTQRARYNLTSYGPGIRGSRSSTATGIRLPGTNTATQSSMGLRGSSIPVSRIPRSLTRIPMPNTRSNPSSRGHWKDGCH